MRAYRFAHSEDLLADGHLDPELGHDTLAKCLRRVGDDLDAAAQHRDTSDRTLSDESGDSLERGVEKRLQARLL
jgi:hypothetical protein